MVSWLVNKLAPRDRGNATADTVSISVETRTRAGFAASIICICCNVVLCLGKGIVGLAAGSVALIADAVNNLSDASSNIVSLLGFRLAARPADAGHPYGHGRYEYLAGLTVAVLVCAVGINLVTESVGKIVHPTHTEYDAILIAVLVASMLVKLWMAAFNSLLGKRIDSETLAATAVDSRNDVVASAAILLSIFVSKTAGIDLDGWAGLGVGIFVCVGGVGLIRDAVSPLLGEAPSQELIERINRMILSYPGVLGAHDLMMHDYGPGRQFASAHVEMDGSRDAFEDHKILDTIEHAVRRETGVEITLHCDPIAVGSDSDTEEMRTWFAACVKDIDPRLSIHDLHRHGDAIAFDLVVPDSLGISDDELLERITSKAKKRYPNLPCIITFDTGFMSPVSKPESLASDKEVETSEQIDPS